MNELLRVSIEKWAKVHSYEQMFVYELVYEQQKMGESMQISPKKFIHMNKRSMCKILIMSNQG